MHMCPNATLQHHVHAVYTINAFTTYMYKSVDSVSRDFLYITKSQNVRLFFIFKLSRPHIHDSQLIFYRTSPRMYPQTIMAVQTSNVKKGHL